ncbi:MAG: hypothetical protein AAFV07_04235 [Bacteroidota bacterium]
MSALRYLIFVSIALGFACQPASQTTVDTSTPEPAPDFQLLLGEEFQNAQAYQPTETITMDLTGDGQPEKIVLQPVPNRLNLVIADGVKQTATTILAGPGKGNYDWVDYWGIVQDSIAEKATVVDGAVVGSTMVKLPHPAIVFRKLEAAGGMIAYYDSAYHWIPQAK